MSAKNQLKVIYVYLGFNFAVFIITALGVSL